MIHRLFEDSTRINGVRPPYQPGDPLNRINWRASARAGSCRARPWNLSAVAYATIVLLIFIAPPIRCRAIISVRNSPSPSPRLSPRALSEMGEQATSSPTVGTPPSVMKFRGMEP